MIWKDKGVTRKEENKEWEIDVWGEIYGGGRKGKEASQGNGAAEL